MKVIVVSGRVVADPVIRTVGQDKVANFTVANNDQEKVEFYSVEAWNGRATYAEKVFKKGTHIVVSGSFAKEAYTSADGKKMEKFSIKATGFEVFKTAATKGKEQDDVSTAIE